MKCLLSSIVSSSERGKWQKSDSDVEQSSKLSIVSMSVNKCCRFSRPRKVFTAG